MMISWRRWKGQGQGQFHDDKLEEVEGARSGMLEEMVESRVRTVP